MLAFVALLHPVVSALSGHVSGGTHAAPLRVRVYKLQQDAQGPLPITKQDLYRDLAGAMSCGLNVSHTTCSSSGDFSLDVHAGHQYAVFAWSDENGDGQLDLGAQEPVGWYADGSNWMTPVKADATSLKLRVAAAAPFPADPLETDHGRLHRVAKIPTLSVQGSAGERGYAHGFLLGRQVLDFFRFFTLEETTPNIEVYEKSIVPFISATSGWHSYASEYLEEVDALIAGMRASPSLNGSMNVPELGRDFAQVDLL